jgi:peroxiredoxin
MNFALLDHKGRFHELRRADARAVVLYFTGNGCPIARQSYEKLKALRKQFLDQGVVFWLINANSADDRASIEKEAREFKVSPLPVLKDDSQGVARLLGVKRTGEAIAIRTKDWAVFYRGAIDDQFVEGAKKPAASAKYLETALNEFLAGKPVGEPKTAARGCLIHFESPTAEPDRQISYAKEIAPLLEQKCVGCHSPGNIGPFAMSSYRKVKSMADMIHEVVLARRMPPWDADPHYGKFANDRSLTVAETRLLLGWIEQGAPRGEGDDPLEKLVVPVTDWPLGQPDLIVPLPELQSIPATGVVDYRYVDVPSSLTNEVWLGAAAIRPGNLKVTHHVIVRIKYPKQGKTSLDEIEGLEGWSPGRVHYAFPEGTGKRLRAGAVFNFELHYNTTGKAETDRTELGLYFLKEKPRMSYKTIFPIETDLNIPPGEADVRASAIAAIKRDTLLYSFVPHMHTRGAWMKYEALYPDGRRETLLSVPRYDFNWQLDYRLAEPKLLPAGAWLYCTGGFDNSARNPHNPDPAKRVRWGDQSFEEMFIGFAQVAEVPGSKRAGKE